MLVKLKWLGYRTVKKLWQYVKLFFIWYRNITDGRTDGRTELLYQYRASVCWHAIKIANYSACAPKNIKARLHLALIEGACRVTSPIHGYLLLTVACHQLLFMGLSIKCFVYSLHSIVKALLCEGCKSVVGLCPLSLASLRVRVCSPAHRWPMNREACSWSGIWCKFWGSFGYLALICVAAAIQLAARVGEFQQPTRGGGGIEV